MRLKWLAPVFRLLMVALLAFGATARAASAIIGTVVSAETKQPALDVVVSATSPALQGEQVVVTDEKGHYRIPELPPGVYTLWFEKDGAFKAFTRADLPLREGKSLRVNVELLAGDPADFMIGPCGPALIDVGSATTGRNVSSVHAERVALNRPADPGGAARPFDALAELAPGVLRDTYGLSINGASAFENAYVVDGLYSTDSLSGIHPRPLSIEFLQDFTVITGGYMPEYGRSTGGILAAETRSGSNEFHGSVFANWAPGLLEGTRTHATSGGLAGSGQNALKNLGDFGGTLEGPLVKDTLRFFAGLAPALTRWEHTRTIPGGSRTFFADQRSFQALGKLTYLINYDHTVTLVLTTAPTRSGGVGRLTVDPLTGGVQERIDSPHDSTGTDELDSNFTTTALHYQAALFDKRLLWDTHFGWSRQTQSSQHVDGGDGVRIDRYQATSKATYMLNLVGQHLVKAGLDAEFRIAELPSRSTSHLLGGFVQDSWYFARRFTLNAGVRYDVWSLDGGDGPQAPLRSHPLSPRLGMVVDPFANGRMKLFAHYAKYRAPVLLRARTNTPAIPAVILPASTEWVAGVEAELLDYSSRLISTYTHRDLDSARGEGPERTYDAVTVAFARDLMRDWLAEVSYTWSHLRGNDLGSSLAGTAPGGRASFDLGASAEASNELLPYDRTHVIKAFGAREFHLTRQLRASVGLSYRGLSGAPVSFLTSGSTQRTPWVHTLDSTVRVGYRPGRPYEEELSFVLGVFNLLNSQQVTRVVEVGTNEAELVEYQSPRQVRFGVRYTF